MPFDFTIRIIGGAGGAPAQFVPQRANPGDPLEVKVGDTVSWGNDTAETHQPWPVDADHQPLPDPPVPFLSNPIPPMQASSPAWVVVGSAGTTIHYRCRLHDGETGTIVIT